LQKKKVLQSLISIGTYEQFILNILKLSEEKQSSYICVSNVHMTIEGYDDKKFLNIVNNADITTPDGMPLAKAIKLLYNIHQDRVAGMDLMPSLMQESEKLKKSIFLYGSTDHTLKKIISKAKIDYPLLKIDYYSPPFRELSENEKTIIINKINDNRYDFVFVALGCPKQEKWMAEHKNKINSCMIGLGGALEVYADIKNRAPLWMQNYSLEWIYRLIQDPKRLWKRYLYTNNKFLLLFLLQFIKIKLLKKG
jgi:N-acetylglucosaminyldiphosphoundecaprenol N-acetyl-beta-D-mannosaminyltransferase